MMKNLLTLLFSVSIVVFMSSASASAQGRGLGSGPRVPGGQGHGQRAARDEGRTGSEAHANGHEAWETKFNARVQNDPAFASRLDKLLPPGTDLKTAENGFRNRGQFIAALEVSKNLNIPFNQLKAKVTGVNGQTSSTPMSLGKAIHELRPDMTQDQATDQAKKAETQAKEMEQASRTSSN